MTDWKEQMQTVWDVLDKMPSTNAKLATGMLLAYGSGFAYFIMLITGRDEKMNVEAFATWLIFVGGFVGIAAWQYGKKRDSYVPPAADMPESESTTGSPPAVVVETKATGAG